MHTTTYICTYVPVETLVRTTKQLFPPRYSLQKHSRAEALSGTLHVHSVGRQPSLCAVLHLGHSGILDASKPTYV